MSHLIDNLRSFALFDIITLDNKSRKTILSVICGDCIKEQSISAEALYRQKKRGAPYYRCQSCAGAKAWNQDKRREAGDRTRRQWDNPQFCGTITGKAIAREVLG